MDKPQTGRSQKWVHKEPQSTEADTLERSHSRRCATCDTQLGSEPWEIQHDPKISQIPAICPKWQASLSCSHLSDFNRIGGQPELYRVDSRLSSWAQKIWAVKKMQKKRPRLCKTLRSPREKNGKRMEKGWKRNREGTGMSYVMSFFMRSSKSETLNFPTLQRSKASHFGAPFGGRLDPILWGVWIERAAVTCWRRGAKCSTFSNKKLVKCSKMLQEMQQWYGPTVLWWFAVRHDMYRSWYPEDGGKLI